MKIVLVKWVDSASANGWKGRESLDRFIKGDLDAIKTVGMLVHQDKKKVVLIQSDGDNQAMGLFEIPRGCIKSIKTIGKV